MARILILFLLLPVLSFSQEIKTNVVDGFTNERTIETSIVSLKQGVSTGFGVSYTAVKTRYYINVIGYGKANSVITDTDSIWLVLNNGAIAKLNSPVEFSNDVSEYQNMYIHHYNINLNMVEAFKNNPLVMVRVLSSGRNDDVKISKKNSRSLSKLSDIFLTEVSK